MSKCVFLEAFDEPPLGKSFNIYLRLWTTSITSGPLKSYFFWHFNNLPFCSALYILLKEKIEMGVIEVVQKEIEESKIYNAEQKGRLLKCQKK